MYWACIPPTLKMSFMLLSMKTTIRSSFSFERALLRRIALEKDLFTASLFSIYRFNSTSSISNYRKTADGKFLEQALFFIPPLTCLPEDRCQSDDLTFKNHFLGYLTKTHYRLQDSATSSHLLVQLYPLRVTCQSHECKQPAQLVSAGGRQQLETQLQSLKSCAQLGIDWEGKRGTNVSDTEVAQI